MISKQAVHSIVLGLHRPIQYDFRCHDCSCVEWF